MLANTSSSSLRLLCHKAKTKQTFASSSQFLIRSFCQSSSTSELSAPSSSTTFSSSFSTSPSSTLSSSLSSSPSSSSQTIPQKFLESFTVKESLEKNNNKSTIKNLLNSSKLPKLNSSLNHFERYKKDYDKNSYFTEDRFKDQIDLEIFQFNSALHERQKITNTMLTMGKASDMKFISKHVLVWTKYLIQVIEKELELFYKGESSIDRSVSFLTILFFL